MNFKITFVSILLLMATLSTNAQTKLNGGSGGLYIGGKGYDVSKYEHFLGEGINDLNDNLFTLGGGGYHIFNNLLIGGYGFYRQGDSEEVSLYNFNGGENFEYALRGGGGYFTVGYVVFQKSNKVIAFPQLGLGFESLSLNKNTIKDVVILDGQLLSTEYSWNSPMLDLGLGIDFYFLKYFKVGVRTGYNLSLQNNDDWQHRGADFRGTGLPENNLDGFYFNLVFGGGKLK